MKHQWALSVSHDNMGDEKWLDTLYQQQIRNVEYSCTSFPLRRAIENNLKKLSPLLEGGTLKCTSLHLPFYWAGGRPASSYEQERKRCVAHLADMISLFSPLGMKHITMHPGSAEEGQPRDEALSCVRRTIEELLPFAERSGAKLNLEICPRGSLGGTPEEMEELLEGLPDSAGICFDVNHADSRWSEVPQWIARLGKRINTFHISDCDGIDECHWMPGSGILDWAAIMKEINNLGHECLLIYEVHADGFKPPAFLNRPMDPRWFVSAVRRNMDHLESLI